MRNIYKIIKVIACCLMVVNAVQALSQTGVLDVTFGNGGKVTTNLGGGGVSGAVMQQDGKFVFAGSSLLGQITLIRYNTNGSIDSSYGTNGIAAVNFQMSVRTQAIQPDGKTLVAGNTNLSNNNTWDIAIARFNLNGSIDSTFGNNGLKNYFLL